jgi:S-adenosylmethionine hydrolase
MIVLFTDFGVNGPYVGQMKAVLHVTAPGVPVVDLLHDAPAFEPRLSAYLLAAYAREFPAGAVFVCVVDPGVGSSRRPVIARAGGHVFVGPDNGLLHAVLDHADAASLGAWEIGWRPERLSDSFHGRDLFAPVAGRLAMGARVEHDGIQGSPINADTLRRRDWPADLLEIVCVDPYGNLITGLRAAGLGPEATIEAAARRIGFARTFSEVPAGTAFWHHNSNGLVEIAVNQASAAAVLGLGLGDVIRLDRPGGSGA